MAEEKGKIIIIKRNGQDRVTYPLVSNSCLFGSGLDCDIRVQLPSVSERHCALKVGLKDKVYLTSLSHGNITLLNDIPVSGTVPVNHKDILTVVDRCFRFEYPPKSNHYVEEDTCASVPEVKSLKVLSPREKPPLFQVNGTPGKTPSSVKKKMIRKSVGSADIHIFNDELSPLSHPRKSYSKKNLPSPRSIALSAKRKRVSFGPALSPEQFDKNMPPATPVRRGSLPRRHATTPDYFGSPIITQYPRSKKKRLSVIPREQSIVEEILHTSDVVNQSPRDKYAVSPKSLSASAVNKLSPKTKGSPIQMLQQEESKKTPDVTRKSPLARKSPKSASQSPLSRSSKPISPTQSPVPSYGKGKTNPGDTDTEVAIPLSSSLSDSPKQTAIKAQKSSPFKSQHNTPSGKGSLSKLSPSKVWASSVSPGSKHASPLSRRKSSVPSPVNLSSVAVTPSHSLKTQVTDKSVSSGKKSRSRAVKRLSAGKSPARPVSFSTPSQKSPVKVQKKTSSTSKVRYSYSSTPQSLLEENSTEKSVDEVPLSKNQTGTVDFGSTVSDLVENFSSHVTTPRSSSKRQSDREKPKTGKRSSSAYVLKRLSAVKTPAHSPSLSTPLRRSSGKFLEKRSSSKPRQSFLFMSDSAKEASFSEDHPGEKGVNDADSSKSFIFDQVIDDNIQTPVSGCRSESRATPKSSSKRQSSAKQNSVTETILTPVSAGNDVSKAFDAKQVTPTGASRMSRSPVTPKSSKKTVSSPSRKSSVSEPKTPRSKRKSSSSLSPQSAKKARLSATPNLKLSTSSNRVSPKSQSSLSEAISVMSPKELPSKLILASPEGQNVQSTPSKLKASASKTPQKTKSASVNSKNKTPVKVTPEIKASPFPSKESAKTSSSKTSSRSEVGPSSVKAKLETSTRASPLAKSPSSAAKRKFSLSVKKITPVGKKSLAKKAVPSSRSVKKLGTSSPSRLVRSSTKSARKGFSIKKSSKKPLWTEIVRRGIMKKKVTSKPKVVRSLLSNAVKTKKIFKSSNKKFLQKSVPTPNKKIISAMSTGHAESPETIVIQKRRSTLPRPGRIRTPRAKDLQSPPPDSTVTTVDDMSNKISPLHSSVKSKKTSLSVAKRKTLLGHQKDSPDISLVSTPNISQERFVSPLTTPRISRKNNSFLEKYVLENQHVIKTVKSSRKSENLVGVKRLLKSGTPKADYSNIAGIKSLVQTPKTTPKANYSDVRGIGKLVQTPKDSPEADHQDVRGLRRSVQTPKDSPKADYHNVRGLRRLIQTPKDSPKADYRDVRGVKRLVQTPKDSPKADYRDVRGVKRLVQTPKDSPQADYRDVRGVKRLVQTPKDAPKADYRDVRGIRSLVRTPKKSPVADYRNVSGVKNLLRTPASAKHGVSQAKTVSIKQLYQNHTPPADYTKVKGLKQLFKTAHPAKGKARARKTKNTDVKEPDYTHVEGVKQLFREPEENEFNISGLQQLFSPVPPVSFGAKTDIVSPTVQESSPFVQKVSSPKSRRKQSFGPLSVVNLDDDRKKSVQITSPVLQENAPAVEHTAGVEDVTGNPPNVREGSGRGVSETLGSANKASRSTRSVTATPTQQQTPVPLHPPSARKTAGTVMPLDTPSGSVSGKSPKMKKPEKNVISPFQSVATTPSPNMISPKTRQQTPLSAKGESHDRKNSRPQKQKTKGSEEEEKLDAEANKANPSAIQNVSPVSTPQRAKRGGKDSNIGKTPEIIVISDDDDDVTAIEQRPKRGKSRSAISAGKHKVLANKGRKKGIQKIPDSFEAQKVVTPISPQRNARAVQNKRINAAEVSVASDEMLNDLSGDKRATRSKASGVKKRGGSQNATEVIPKGGRSTRSKKKDTATDEVSEYSQEQTSDLCDMGGRSSRKKTAISPAPVGQSFSSPGISSPKVDKRGKVNKLYAGTKDDSLHLSGREHEHNETPEVRGARKTRGRRQAVGTPVKNTASQSVVPSADEHKVSKVTRRGARGSQNLLPEADSSVSPVEDAGVDVKTLPHLEKVSTSPSKRRTVSKQKKQISLSNDVTEILVSAEHEAVAETSSSTKSVKTRRNRKLPVSTAGNEKAPIKTSPTVVATPQRTRRLKRMGPKSDDAVASLDTELVKDDTNTPDMSKEPRPQRNRKDSQEVKHTSTGNRRSKRGRHQDNENVTEVLPKQPKTQDQKSVSLPSADSSGASIDSVDSSDAVRRSTRGKTLKNDTPREKTEVPDAKQLKKRSKKSSVNEEDGIASQTDVSKTTAVSKEKHSVGSPSSQNVVVKKGKVQTVVQAPSESERPKRIGRTTRSVSSEDGDAAVNSRRSRVKRSAADPVNAAVSPKRTRKETVVKEGANALEEVTKTAKVQAKSSKMHSPVLDSIPEVEEETAVTPTMKKATRAKASLKQSTKESPVRRTTRSRRK